MCCDYNGNLQSFHNRRKHQGSKDIAEVVDLILSDSAYNLCCQQDLRDTEDDVLIGKNVEAIFKFSKNDFRRGGYGHIY